MSKILQRKERKKALRKEQRRLEAALAQLNDAFFNYVDAAMRDWCSVQMDRVRAEIRQVEEELRTL